MPSEGCHVRFAITVNESEIKMSIYARGMYAHGERFGRAGRIIIAWRMAGDD